MIILLLIILMSKQLKENWYLLQIFHLTTLAFFYTELEMH